MRYSHIVCMQHWSKVDHQEWEPQPVGRRYHAAVCLGYGDGPHVLITGGEDSSYNILSDMWLLDVESGKWREVCRCLLHGSLSALGEQKYMFVCACMSCVSVSHCASHCARFVFIFDRQLVYGYMVCNT